MRKPTLSIISNISVKNNILKDVSRLYVGDIKTKLRLCTGCSSSEATTQSLKLIRSHLILNPLKKYPAGILPRESCIQCRIPICDSEFSSSAPAKIRVGTNALTFSECNSCVIIRDNPFSSKNIYKFSITYHYRDNRTYIDVFSTCMVYKSGGTVTLVHLAPEEQNMEYVLQNIHTNIKSTHPRAAELSRAILTDIINVDMMPEPGEPLDSYLSRTSNSRKASLGSLSYDDEELLVLAKSGCLKLGIYFDPGWSVLDFVVHLGINNRNATLRDFVETLIKSGAVKC